MMGTTYEEELEKAKKTLNPKEISEVLEALDLASGHVDENETIAKPKKIPRKTKKRRRRKKKKLVVPDMLTSEERFVDTFILYAGQQHIAPLNFINTVKHYTQ